MLRLTAVLLGVSALASFGAAGPISEELTPAIVVDTKAEPVAGGPFAPTWASLKQYKAPAWFRDAKFGIWAHWGAQCQPERGDWYARNMYYQDSRQYRAHLELYGHPSTSGFKEVIHAWKADKWDPDRLVALYKKTGAQYFFAMANHHDNLDNWDSRYQPWNTVALGPRRDLIAGWAAAAKKQGLPFGVSVHAAHAWSWYESSRGADRTGALAGVAYDGRLTKADGKGLWWDGFDPQDLYEQRHEPSPGWQDANRIHSQWNWGEGATTPDRAYCEKFYNRTMDLINRYQPELLYFDDTALPLWPVSDAGLKIAAHFYNSSVKRNGDLRAVLFGKILNDEQQRAMVWDIERGVPATKLANVWQTDTCIGGWHYDRTRYKNSGYKPAKQVVQMLADIVSKNGNLLLNVPVRGDGSIDEKEEKILGEIGAWMDVNREAIVGTRPWTVFGEGPASDGAPISAQGFNEGKGKPFTEGDVRFTQKGDVLYVIALNRPTRPLVIRSLGTATGLLAKPVKAVSQLGGGPVKWTQTGDALTIEVDTASVLPTDVVAFKITTN